MHDSQYSSQFSPDPSEYHRQVPSFKNVKGRRNPKENIWFFDSPKNDQRFTIATDLLFINVILLEGDVDVSRYVFAASSDEPTIRVYRQDGEAQWWDVKHSKRVREYSKGSVAAAQVETLKLSAAAAGATYVLKTERDIRGKEILFDNWLNLCSAITRCRTMSTEVEAVALKEAFIGQPSLPLSELLRLPDTDPAHMLALVALSLQGGQLRTDLDGQLFGPRSILTRRYV